jgi:hypothetical protein
MGETTEKCPVVYLTEQSPSSFREALRRANLLDRDDLSVLCWRDTVGVPWPKVVDAAIAEAERISAGLLVVDTLSPFAGLKGDAENNAGNAMAAMEPLKKAAGVHDLAVDVIRHERKGGGDIGESGRGSSAFIAEVDIHLSMRRVEGNNPDARQIESLIRYDETPDKLIIELTNVGYAARGSEKQIKFRETLDELKALIPDNPDHAVEESKLIDGVDAGRDTVRSTLNTLRDRGEVDRIGEGKKGSPYRYYRPLPTSVEMLSDETPTRTPMKSSESETESEPNEAAA